MTSRKMGQIAKTENGSATNGVENAMNRVKEHEMIYHKESKRRTSARIEDAKQERNRMTIKLPAITLRNCLQIVCLFAFPL